MKRNFVELMHKFEPTSFLSCEKDVEAILKLLFLSNRPCGEALIRLLTINAKDCLDSDKQEYIDRINSMSLAKLKEDGYIKLVPKIPMGEHEDVKAYIIISFDNFMETDNTEFRNCTITFDILCHTECWDLGNFRIRPLKIAGYIDGMLNKARLSGIGQLRFLNCKELLLDETLAGYTLTYIATHGSDDVIPNNN